MPFKKSVMSASGVLVDFHRVESVNWSRSSGICEIQILSYLSQSAAAAGKDPLITRVFKIAAIGNANQIQAALKLLPDFSDAEEV